MKMTGFTNAVECLALAIQKMGGEIDSDSFDRMAQLRGDGTPEQIASGFIVEGYEGLQRLCEIGNVIIVHEPDGKVHCYDPSEWKPTEQRHASAE